MPKGNRGGTSIQLSNAIKAARGEKRQVAPCQTSAAGPQLGADRQPCKIQIRGKFNPIPPPRIGLPAQHHAPILKLVARKTNFGEAPSDERKIIVNLPRLAQETRLQRVAINVQN